MPLENSAYPELVVFASTEQAATLVQSFADMLQANCDMPGDRAGEPGQLVVGGTLLPAHRGTEWADEDGVEDVLDEWANEVAADSPPFIIIMGYANELRVADPAIAWVKTAEGTVEVLGGFALFDRIEPLLEGSTPTQVARLPLFSEVALQCLLEDDHPALSASRAFLAAATLDQATSLARSGPGLRF